jgi:site-specific recombinase XerD
VEVLAGVERKHERWVFPGASGEKPVQLDGAWKRIRAEAKFEGVTMHDLRHSFASVAASGGASLLVIGSLLGHTRVETTRRYAHLSDDRDPRSLGPHRLEDCRHPRREAAGTGGVD